MNWTLIRGLGYAIAFAMGTAVVAMNLGTFDPDTGMIDPHPFNLYTAVAAALAFMGAPLTALIAVVKGWGQKR
jgi:hypothetical protein